MVSFFDKKKVFQLLFFTTIFLIIANLIIDKYFVSKSDSEISGTIINEKFREAVFNFGLKEEWIKSNTVNRKISDSLFASYNINVPADLPITIMLNEIVSLFSDEPVLISSKEKKINGTTLLNISSGKKLKLTAEFKYNSTLKRKAGIVGILIEGLEDIEKDSVILNFPENFASVIIPSKESSKFVKKIIDYKKEYAVMIGDAKNDLDYKLSSSYSENRLKNSIRAIAGGFPHAICFLADNNSEIYSSRVFSFIKNEFVKRKIALIDLGDVEKLNEGEDIFLNFRKMVENSNGKGKLIFISSEAFRELIPEIIKLRKIGYKFVNPSTILKFDSSRSISN